MLQIVGALILLIAGFAILRLLFRALISTASALAGLILLCLFGPALLAGYIIERITRLFHIRWLFPCRSKTFSRTGSHQKISARKLTGITAVFILPFSLWRVLHTHH